MSRRSSRKAENISLETEPSVPPSVTPKKGRKFVKVETTEVVAQNAKSSTKVAKRTVKAEVQSDEEGPSPAKVNKTKVKSETVVEEQTARPKKAVKRKVKDEDEDEDGDQDTNKTKKKRKTKEEKEAEAMPIAARTAVASLKSAMHIGAHVSGAGGMSRIPMYW